MSDIRSHCGVTRDNPTARPPHPYNPPCLALTPGSRIGPYQLASRIGVGGMGEVYRARDTTLNRQVAIKVLLPAVANDPDRLARFRREAQVLASLNHPHIAQIHGFEEADGVRALVMELVDGPTLADRIASGAIAIAEALQIATQIAEALEAAHEQGIIHRDLKPANIKVREDGTVKVLDFGLAKALDTQSGAGVDATRSPTLSAHATETGIILGTAAYMSPEQARGRPVDRRADLWAFGCVLYEMLTGQLAFPGEGASDTLAHVLMKEPDWNALPADTPAPIRRLLRRCVEKDRKQRLDSATAARLEIDEARAAPSADTPAREPVPTRVAREGQPFRLKRRERVAWFVAVASIVAALAAIVAAALPWRRAAPELAVLRLDVTTPQTGDPTSFALSPDGRQIVFVAAGEGGSKLWLRLLDQTTAQPLPSTEGATFPFWAPDSRAIGFFADAKLKRLDLPGGKAQELADASNGRGGAWSRDGVILFAANVISGLLRVPATGGTPTSVTRPAPGELGHRFPDFLPDGRRFIFWVGPSPPEVQGLYLGSLDAPETHRLVAADAGGAYAHPGYLLWPRQGVLVAAPFDAARGALSGDPIPIAPAVGSSVATNRSAFSVSTTGLLAYRTGVTGRSRLVWMDRGGTVVRALGPPDENQLVYPEPSPDGQRVAVQRTVQGNMDIWQVDAARGITSRFTFDTSVDSTAVWHPMAAAWSFAPTGTACTTSSRNRRPAPATSSACSPLQTTRFLRTGPPMGTSSCLSISSRTSRTSGRCQSSRRVLGHRSLSSGRASPRIRGSSHPMGSGFRTGRTSRDGTRSTCRHFRGRVARRGYRRKAAANRAGGATGRSCFSSRRTTS